MTTTEAPDVAEAAACLKDALDRDSTLDEMARGRYLKSYNCLRGLIHGIMLKSSERARNAAEWLTRTENKPTNDLFDPANLPADPDEVPGQQVLDGIATNGTVDQAEPSGPNWSTQNLPIDAIDNGLVQALRDGAGRSKAIDLVMSATGKSKFEIEDRWNTLIRSGAIKKDGRNWITEQPSEAPSEATVG